MRFSVRWLKNYLQTELSAEELADALTNCGLEVEEVIDLGMISGNIVTGEILKIEPIEGADKIRLCSVMADGKEPLKIVCGAQNISEGDIVPVAKFGMIFPDGFELKPRKIMGIEGQGMLCSAKELGVAEDADGIWLLPKDTIVAEPYDALIEIAITPNRPDALSIIGVARDLAAKIAAMSGKRPNVMVPAPEIREAHDRADAAAKLTLRAKADCPRYAARVIRGVTIGPSPRWLQIVLESAGLRPINNIVDITNFVMLELGHPLHAFDLDLLHDNHIVVRNAEDGEKIQTLDEQEYTLTSEDLLICDAAKPVALAGIMGGGNSEISEETKNVLLECAYFRPSTIRKTAKRLGKSTDSSYRFERGMDPKKLTTPLDRAAELIQELAGGEVLKGRLDAMGPVTEKEPVVLRLARLNSLLGLDLSGKDVADVLKPLGFEVMRADREEMTIQIPSHRVDVSIEADIVEEVARIIGYDKIPMRPVTMTATYQKESELQRARRILSEAATAMGYHEAINFSFTTEEANALAGRRDAAQVRIQNPITVDQSVMRRSLLPSLLQNALHNFNHSVEEVRLFEYASTYEFPDDPEEEHPRGAGDIRPPAIETPYFAMLLAGGGKPSWREPAATHDFYEIKGAAETLLMGLGHDKLVVEELTSVPWLHPSRAARFLAKGEPLAIFGEVHPAVLKELDIRKPAFYLEIELAGRAVNPAGDFKFKELPRYPAITRDIALVVDRKVRSLDLERAIMKLGRELLSTVKVFDVYEGQHVEAGKKSLAFALAYRASDRTLKEEEVTAIHEKVLEGLKKEFGAELRS